MAVADRYKKSYISTTLLKIGRNGMSDDETDWEGEHEDEIRRRYRIKEQAYRNPIVTDWLRTLDTLYKGMIFEKGPCRGNPPRNRLSARPLGKDNYSSPIAKVPKGLPRSFYRPDWLNTLEKFDLKSIEVEKNTDLSWTHDEEIRS